LGEKLMPLASAYTQSAAAQKETDKEGITDPNKIN
jgi:hypothetical protein